MSKTKREREMRQVRLVFHESAIKKCFIEFSLPRRRGEGRGGEGEEARGRTRTPLNGLRNFHDYINYIYWGITQIVLGKVAPDKEKQSLDGSKSWCSD